jgi:transcriptional regulator with XRE-family HTH domain
MQDQALHRAGKGKADAEDLYVGERIRNRRNALQMSQEQLADRLGITFQQVQKYERGANRVSATRLNEISKILGVPVSFFFAPVPNGLAEGQGEFADPLVDLIRLPETQNLVRAYWRIPDEGTRQRVFELVTSMSANGNAID